MFFTRSEVEDNLSGNESREWLSRHASELKRSSGGELIDILFRLGEVYSKKSFTFRNGGLNKSALSQWLNEITTGVWNTTTANEALRPGGSLNIILFKKLLILLDVSYEDAKSYVIEAYPSEAVAFNPNVIEDYCCMCGLLRGWDIAVVNNLIAEIKKLIPELSRVINKWVDDKGLRTLFRSDKKNKDKKKSVRTLITCAEEYFENPDEEGIKDIIVGILGEDMAKKFVAAIDQERNKSNVSSTFKYSSSYTPDNVSTVTEEMKYTNENPTETAVVVEEDEVFITKYILSPVQAFCHAKDKIRHFRKTRLSMRNIVDDVFCKYLDIDIFNEGVLEDIANDLHITHKNASLDHFTDTLRRCIFRNSKNVSRQVFLECLLYAGMDSSQEIDIKLASVIFEKKLDVFILLDACVYEACKRARREKKKAWELYVDNYNSIITPPVVTPPEL